MESTWVRWQPKTWGPWLMWTRRSWRWWWRHPPVPCKMGEQRGAVPWATPIWTQPTWASVPPHLFSTPPPTHSCTYMFLWDTVLTPKVGLNKAVIFLIEHFSSRRVYETKNARLLPWPFFLSRPHNERSTFYRISTALLFYYKANSGAFKGDHLWVP